MSNSDVLKIFILTFLFVQAIRQLVLVNQQFTKKIETRAGQVSSWFTIVLSLAVVGILSQGDFQISDDKLKLALIPIIIGAMGSGIAMVYDKVGNKETVEPARLWFGIVHILFALACFIFLVSQ
jgi:hypothetical protein